MNNWWQVDPLFPIWLVIIILLLSLFFVWKEAQRTHRFKIARVVAQLIITISLAGILLRPSALKQQRSDALLLLTPGYSKTIADSIIKSNGAIPVYHTPGIEGYKNSQELSYHELGKVSPRIKYITGQGLPSSALAEIQNHAVDFIPSPIPQGIIQLAISNPVKVNQPNTVSGYLKTNGKTTLTLSGPGAGEDSVSIKTKGNLPFTLLFNPKEAGNYLYSFTIKDENGNTTMEKLPIRVLPLQTLRILVLQQFPSFETKYLKNFLMEQGHQIILRQQVSKATYRYEYANTAKEVINHLTPSLLGSFDLVLIDSDMLDKLPANEMTAVKQAVKGGLGIVILFNNIPSKIKSLTSFAPFHFQPVASDTIHITSSKKEKYVLPIQPELVSPDPSVMVINKSNNKILSGYAYEGVGKISFQSVRETFSILLKGDKEEYAALWSPLLEQTARTKSDVSSIAINNSFPYYENEPLSLTVISSRDDISLKQDNTTMPLAEDVAIDGLWHGTTWADKEGWHSLTTPADSSALHYYVSNTSEWNTLRIANQLKENSLFFTGSNSIQGSTERYKDPVSLALFFVMFLLASGFLWLAPKL